MTTDPITWTTTHGDTVEVYVQEQLCRDLGCAMPHPTFWRYRITAANNKKVERDSEAYARKSAAIKAALRHHPRVGGEA